MGNSWAPGASMTPPPRPASIYMWTHLCVCLRMRTCLFEGVCLCWSVTVYTLSASGHTQTECVLFPLVREGVCVCVKTWFSVGVCLINCESVWEIVCLFIWVRAREKEQNEEVEKICPSASIFSQSAHSHTNLFIWA